MTLRRVTVQPGTTARLRIEVETDPAESGKAGAFELKEAVLSPAGGSPVDLMSLAAPWVAPAMIERAYPTPSGGSASVTADPTYSAGGGPTGENVYIVDVDDSSDFTVADISRAADQGEGEGQGYEVLEIPDGTHLHLHAKQAGFDIIDGDTVEGVEATGVYVGYFELDVDDYLSAAVTTAELHIVMVTVATGDDPKFNTAQTLTWTFSLELDLAGRGYKAG